MRWRDSNPCSSSQPTIQWLENKKGKGKKKEKKPNKQNNCSNPRAQPFPEVNFGAYQVSTVPDLGMVS